MELIQAQTVDEARQVAVNWQHWQSERSMSWEQVLTWQRYFEELARKFGLEEEFKENGII